MDPYLLGKRKEFIMPGTRPPAEGKGTMVEKIITGNYEMNLVLAGNSPGRPGRVFFAGNRALGTRAYLEISADRIRLVRKTGDDPAIWKEYGAAGPPPWQVRIIKKGNFFRLWVNDTTGWIRGPLGEWENVYEPVDNGVGVDPPAGIAVQSCTVTTLPWLQHITEPVLSRGPKGSFYEEQVIPGALMKWDGQYYLYFMAGMKGDEEASSRRTIGVAVSKDLTRWDVHPEPLITCKDAPYDNLYVNGAVSTPEGRVGVMFSAQKFPEWKGFMLATAGHPMGPFALAPENPVYRHFSHAHEFDLLRVDGPGYRYILFYAGFTPQPRKGPPGDRGYLLYSDDLVHWQADPRNPVFDPETPDNWDAVHVRPRSLNRIGDTWYLWYEGCNHWKPEGASPHGWWDTVGLARSKDLFHWAYYPRNPALPALGISADQFDSAWVGWPRMYVEDNVGYVFYTGNAQIGLRTISLADLTNWNTEHGETLDLLG
jgi:predicted GH43/DUF377 family glycosyl hydrolase